MNPLLSLFQVTGAPTRPPGGAIGVNVTMGPGTTEVMCPGCHRPGVRLVTDWNATGHIIGEQARTFTDLIGGFKYLISDQMHDDLRASGVTGFVPHPINIASVESPQLRWTKMPQYYLMEVTGKIQIDRLLFDENEGTVCDACRNYTPKPGGKYEFGDKLMIPVLESWDGSDFVMVRNIKGTPIYCSRKVVELAIEKKWSGFGIKAFTNRLPKPDLTRVNWMDELAQEVKKRFPHLE